MMDLSNILRRQPRNVCQHTSLCLIQWKIVETVSVSGGGHPYGWCGGGVEINRKTFHLSERLLGEKNIHTVGY